MPFLINFNGMNFEAGPKLVKKIIVLNKTEAVEQNQIGFFVNITVFTRARN